MDTENHTMSHTHSNSSLKLVGGPRGQVVSSEGATREPVKSLWYVPRSLPVNSTALQQQTDSPSKKAAHSFFHLPGHAEDG